MQSFVFSSKERAYEYDHEYGLVLTGNTVPQLRPVDSRSKFLEAFHNLLNSCSLFYKEADDTTRISDGFPVLNNLKEVNLLLAEGNHNAYGNLTWTSRQEMLMEQYILARPEMRKFLVAESWCLIMKNGWTELTQCVRYRDGEAQALHIFMN